MAKKLSVPKLEDQVKGGMIDLTKTGPLTYRELQGLNNGLPEESELSQQLPNRPGSDAVLGAAGQINYTGNPYETFGDSKFDDPLANQAQYENYEDLRGERQPWYEQLGAGLAKGAILAGTTFLDGTIGLVVGAGTAISEGRWSGLWDNDFSKAMQAVNQWSEEAMPNYYTQEELESPWYHNIFTANFLGDKFIKNLGFSVGAIYSGGVWTKPLGGVAKLAGLVAKSSQAPAIVSSALGATISAVNEGRIEALNNSNDWYELQKAQLDDKYQQVLASLQEAYEAGPHTMIMDVESGRGYSPEAKAYEQSIAEMKSQYENDLAKLNEDRAKMGNADLLMNLPILLASNIVQFGKYYANGFKTSRHARNIVGDAGKYAVDRSKAGAVLAATKGALSEGLEEISQSAASRVAGDYYADDVTNFYRSKIDPDAEQQTVNWIKSFAQGINETVNDGNAWEEFFIGSLTGALGIPNIKRKANGKLGLGIEGGVVNEIKDYNAEIARQQEIVDYMNKRAQDPKFLNYYQGLIRHNRYQGLMNDAADRGDEFDYKNAEHAQMVSDIIMFDNAGKLQDLKGLVSSAFDVSDENLDAIVRNTTRVTEDKQLVGPYAQYAQLNGDKVEAIFATDQDKQDMISKLTASRDEMMSAIDGYNKIKNDIDIRVGEKISDDQLKELTWMHSQLEDWSKRATSVAGDVKGALGNVVGNITQWRNFNIGIRDYEGTHNSGVTEAYKKADKNVRDADRFINDLSTLKDQDDAALATSLATHEDYVKKVIIPSIEAIPEDVIGKESKEDILHKVDDILRLGNAHKTYKAKLDEYFKNPEKQIEDNAAAHEDVKKQAESKKTSTLREALSSAANMQQFREAINNAEDVETRDKVLSEMEATSPLAKQYKDIENYKTEVRKALSLLKEDSLTTSDALKLLEDQYTGSSSLEEMANMDSVFLRDDHAFDEAAASVEESASRFINAQYALQRAMFKVNSDNQFKDRFTDEYRRPVEKPEAFDATKGADKGSTGSDGTSTVPPVSGGMVRPQVNPVGDLSAEDMAAENVSLNNGVKTPLTLDAKQKGSRKYYRPAVPKYDIEASKRGDFRTFKDVKASEGQDFSAIYDYLESNGAFDYVDKGGLKAGDTIQFMIDPDFESKVEGQSWHTAPTVFMVTSDGQVVGSLDEGASIKSFEGLQGVLDRVRGEYTAAKAATPERTGRFVGQGSTKVSKVMAGKIAYGTEEKSLSIIPMEGEPILGIVKNGVLTTNDKLADNVITKPVNMAHDGRLYMLVPNGAGKYSPVAVRVKHFNDREFNLDDATVSSTPMGREIISSIGELSSATSQDDVANAMQKLGSDLYLGDVMATWYEDNTGAGVLFGKKLRNPDGSYQMFDAQHIKEQKVKVPFQTYSPLEVGGITTTDPAVARMSGYELPTEVRPQAEVIADIKKALMSYNLPLQVSAKSINVGGYNARLLSSGILTSNVTEARVRGGWFTTDYFDSEGVLQKAENPASVSVNNGTTNPVGGTESAQKGIRLRVNGSDVVVDLSTSTITEKGVARGMTNSNYDALLADLAWAEQTFGRATESAIMTDNKVITTEGRVLDRTAQKYLSDEEAAKVKDIISGRQRKQAERQALAQKTIAAIYEHQKLVDKTRTDGENYYVLEEDGQYHPYSRVHTVLGGNWIQSDSQTKALKDIQVRLSQQVDNEAGYNNYLKYLSNHYKVDLSGFEGKTDIKSREAIINTVRDKMSGTNSQRALEAGSAVDSVIRSYFTTTDVSTITRPDNMSEQAFSSLLSRLEAVKSGIEARGERFLTDNIVLFHKYADGTRVAGEVDILAVDADGNFKIYDVKTSRYSFGDFYDNRGNLVNYFSTKSRTQRMSTRDYYTLQLSAYKNLFESQYGKPVTKLAVMPFVLDYNGDMVSNITGEAGIQIKYNPSVMVPLEGAVTPVQKGGSDPIFMAKLGAPTDIMEDHTGLPQDSAYATFLRNGKLVQGKVSKIGVVDGVNVYMHREPVLTKGFGTETYVGQYNYYAVFPNGQSVQTVKNANKDESYDSVAQKVLTALQGNVQRVHEEASKGTPVLLKPETIVETSSNIHQGSEGGTLNQAFARLQQQDGKRRRPKPRQVDRTRAAWNQEKELQWLDKVLPQVRKEDRVKVTEGLLKVAENGPAAWGLYSDGIITLSNLAAEGTAYHEAFHLVMDLMTTAEDKAALFAEAKDRFGDKSDSDLEEDMAEGFREYMLSRDKRGLGKRILDFFENLFHKVTNWKYLKPSLNSYYRMISGGRFADNALTGSTLYKGETKYRIVTKADRQEALKTVKDFYYEAAVSHADRVLSDAQRVKDTIKDKEIIRHVGDIQGHYQRIIAGQIIERMRSQIGDAIESIYAIQLTNSTKMKVQVNLKSRAKIAEEYLKSIDSWSDEQLISEIQRLKSDETHDDYTEDMTTWNDLSKEDKAMLVQKGWSEELYDSVSEEEREQALRCMHM